MKSAILLLAFTAAAASFTGCTSAYKTGQTPDDVYFSPATPENEYVQQDNREDDRYTRRDDQYYEDRYLHMKIRDRYRWSELDDWYYNDYRYRYNVYVGCCFCQDSWSPYSAWNSYYNPYYHNYIVVNPKTSYTYTRPRTFNLNTYNNNSAGTNRNFVNLKNTPSGSTSNSYNNEPRGRSDKGTNTGNFLRNIFSGNNTSSSVSSNSSSNSSSHNSSSSSSSSSGSSHSSSSSAPVRKF